MNRYGAPFVIYNAFIGAAVIYGLLLALVIYVMFTKKRGFPYIHLGFASLCGVITQASVVVKIVDGTGLRDVPGFLNTYLIFYSIQYFIMFLIPIHVARQQSKQIENKEKKKVARILAYIGKYLAYVTIALLIIALIILVTIDGNSSGYSNYQKATAFNYLYLTYSLLHWIFVLFWLIITIRLQKEISSIGTFAGYGFLLILMMVSVTINVIGGGVQKNVVAFDMFWVHFSLYHVCCFIAILMASYFSTIWVQTRSVDNIEPNA
ncbi:unnamed protein product [Cunninghamella echinulata]